MASPNPDLRPSEIVSTIGVVDGGVRQLNLQWGIKPEWAKRLIINAQAETVSVKPTFRAAFEQNRVIVPCAGWYEWKTVGSRKEKFLFEKQDQKPLYIAGIAIGSQLVILTTKPNKQYAEYHHRMPLLVPQEAIFTWINGDRAMVGQLICATHEDVFTVTPLG
ncbi:SOS response-associated peptidase family protein [Vibrio hannami]|nr:SOS response-associated peptidase family protein [Vibrio hannami]MDG3089116.1 SOS response-associated peptidase family protein [Vibrio hannami]